MQPGTTESTYVNNKDVRERRASRPSTISRDMKRVFIRSNQVITTIRSISVSEKAAQGVIRSGLDLTISNNI
jgi:hypothetical protein